jgi:hypothetical protein
VIGDPRSDALRVSTEHDDAVFQIERFERFEHRHDEGPSPEVQ